MTDEEIKQIWKKTLAQIEIKLDAPAQFKMFFQQTKLLQLETNSAIIGVPNPYTSDWLKQRYHKLIQDTLCFVSNKTLQVAYDVYKEENAQAEQMISTKTTLQKTYEEMSPLLSVDKGIMGNVIDTIQKSGLNLKYSMSNYVVGNSNRIAHAASLAVIERPGEVYNPLFLYGKTGVGKTHLVQAIGRSILERNIRKKVVYISSEGFLNEMVKGLKSGRMDLFRAKYREIDILIIDDMQFISKWVQTQEEFFNTFNEMHNAGKQVIMIADRRPEEIKNLEARLRSRMQGGMVADIALPDFEMRMAILYKKAESLGIDLPNHIIEFIARSIVDNVRELEGSLQKVALFNQMKPGGDLSLEEIAHMLGVDAKSKRKNIKVSVVLKEVAKSFGVLVRDIKGSRRTKEIAIARQVAMYILREELNYKLEKIATLVERKDHTTVIHAIDKVKSKMMIQDEFNVQVGNILTAIQETTSVTADID